MKRSPIPPTEPQPAGTVRVSRYVLPLLALAGGCAAAPEPGPCRIEPTGEPLMCTQEYAPVCGCDGKTYPNACMARAAGVQRSRAGTCDESPRSDPEA